MIQHLSFSPEGDRLWALSFSNRFSLAIEGDPSHPRLRLLERRRLPHPGRGAVAPTGETWIVSTNGSSWCDAAGRWYPVSLPPRSVIGSIQAQGRPEERMLGSWGIDARPALILPDDGFRIRPLEYPPDVAELGEAGELVFCPVSRRVFGAMTHGLMAWDRDSGKLLWKRLLDPVGVYGRVAVTPDGRRLAVTLGTRSLHLMDAADGSAIAQLRMPEKLRIASLHWDSRGRRLLAGSAVHATYLWDFDLLRSALVEQGIEAADLTLPIGPSSK
jgi:hypothetical protein